MDYVYTCCLGAGRAYQHMWVCETVVCVSFDRPIWRLLMIRATPICVDESGSGENSAGNVIMPLLAEKSGAAHQLYLPKHTADGPFIRDIPGGRKMLSLQIEKYVDGGLARLTCGKKEVCESFLSRLCFFKLNQILHFSRATTKKNNWWGEWKSGKARLEYLGGSFNFPLQYLLGNIHHRKSGHIQN